MKNLFPCFLKISGKSSEIKENQAPMSGGSARRLECATNFLYPLFKKFLHNLHLFLQNILYA